MEAARRFRIAETVIHQTLDDEAVVINLQNGRYYAFNDSGSHVWNAIVEGHSIDAITQACAATGLLDRAAVERFVDNLVEQNLIVQNSPDVAPSRPARSPLAGVDRSTTRFDEPRMEIYTDMERLLPLDPMHEVDERGWPNRKAGQS